MVASLAAHLQYSLSLSSSSYRSAQLTFLMSLSSCTLATTAFLSTSINSAPTDSRIFFVSVRDLVLVR